MNATLLVTLEIDDPSELQDYADDIHDTLEGRGMPVVSVVPWQRQELNPTTNPLLPNLNENPNNLLG